jgi:hypothetical protein
VACIGDHYLSNDGTIIKWNGRILVIISISTFYNLFDEYDAFRLADKIYFVM